MIAWRVCLIGVFAVAPSLQLTPFEAYQHLSRILEQINVIASEHVSSSLFASEEVVFAASLQTARRIAGCGVSLQRVKRLVCCPRRSSLLPPCI